jgi:prepilin-type N-terminal cleavage/methylation domain-containing protein
MRKNSGFTAFELAVTMAIVVIIAAAALPPYLKWLRGYRLRGAVINMMADLEMAKIRAIRENSLVAVQFCQDRYTVFNENGDTAYTCDSAGRQIYRYRKLPAGVKINLGDLTFVNNRTRFNGRGLPDGTIAEEQIPIHNQASGKIISLNRLGYMNVQ